MTTNSLRPYLTPLPLVAVLRGITPAEVDAVAAALSDNGFRILEVPLNSPEPLASIGHLARMFGERCLTGAGTVLEVADVQRVADAGGRLIVMATLRSSARRSGWGSRVCRAWPPPPKRSPRSPRVPTA